MKKNPLHFILLCCFLPSTFMAQEAGVSFYQLLSQSSNSADWLTENTEIYNLLHLNSEQLDYSPVPFKEGLVFTSTRKTSKKWWKNLFKKEFAYLFYASQRSDGTFFPPLPLKGEINGRLNEGTATFSPDGKVMIFTRNSAKKNKAGQYDLQLYTADYQHGKWINVRALPINYEQYTSCHPSLSADGQNLYFSSNRPGGQGGMDLYVSTWTNQRWSSPINLGPEINSEQHDLFPSIAANGQLFFSSNNAQSMGNYDLFVSQQMADEQWANPQNLGAPFNSVMDDFGFVVTADGQSGYFTSNREGGLGEDDIYAWQLNALPEENIELPLLSQISIIDAQNKTKISSAKISLYELNVQIDYDEQAAGPLAISNYIDEDLLLLIGQELKATKGENGAFLYPILAGKNYLLKAENAEHHTIQQLLSADDLQASYTIAMEYVTPLMQADISQAEDLPIPMIHENQMESSVIIPLVAATAIVPKGNIETTIAAKKPEMVANQLEEKVMADNTAIRLSNIYYGFNQFDLNQSSKTALADLLLLLETHPNMTIRISSHTDARGKASYNLQLSQRRADAVRDYLTEQGIAKSRIDAIGFGESRLINECLEKNDCSEAEHEANRRTEFEVISQ